MYHYLATLPLWNFSSQTSETLTQGYNNGAYDNSRDVAGSFLQIRERLLLAEIYKTRYTWIVKVYCTMLHLWSVNADDDDDDSSERDTSLLKNSTFILHVSVPGWNKGLQPFFCNSFQHSHLADLLSNLLTQLFISFLSAILCQVSGEVCVLYIFH